MEQERQEHIRLREEEYRKKRERMMKDMMERESMEMDMSIVRLRAIEDKIGRGEEKYNSVINDKVKRLHARNLSTMERT